MKLSLFFFLMIFAASEAQIKTNTAAESAIGSENPFLDASNFKDYANNIGKGLVFPRTDLTQWQFITSSFDGFSVFPTAFDGMIVYNTGTGSTLSGQGTVVGVTSGFYYFYNPTGTDDISTGVWKSMGGITGADVVSASTAGIVNNTLLQELGGVDKKINGVRIGKGNGNRIENTVVGSSALVANTTGDYNTAIGNNALFSNGTGYGNTATGMGALRFNTTGFNNTGNGNDALRSNTTGNNNVSNGVYGLFYNTTGSNNVSSGFFAGGHLNDKSSFLSSIDNSVFIGYRTSAKSLSDTNETVIGYDAKGNGSNTVTIGNESVTNNYFTGAVRAGSFIKTGAVGTNILLANGTDVPFVSASATVSGFVNNTSLQELGGVDKLINGVRIGRGNNNDDSSTAIGSGTLLFNTTGDDNTANGYESLNSNTTGSGNTAIGVETLRDNTTGSANTANGSESLHSNIMGSSNTANGTDALYANTTGSSNTGSGAESLRNNAIGSNNVSSGARAGTFLNNKTLALTDINNSTFNGYRTSALANGDTNETVIGYDAKGNGSNTVTIGNEFVTDNYFTGNVRGGAFIKTGATGTNLLRADGSDIPMPALSASWGSISGTLSNQADLQNALDLKANIDSPDLTGTPSAPTATMGTNTSQIATTEFVLANSLNIPHLGYNNTNSTLWNLGMRDNISNEDNTSFGVEVLQSNTTGRRNTGYGYDALRDNTTGNFNTATGFYALAANTTGRFNTATGSDVLAENSTGTSNTANGVSALGNNQTGDNNSAFGYSALRSNSNGTNNVAFGKLALYANTGSSNTAIGTDALKDNIIGNNNIAIGHLAGANVFNGSTYNIESSNSVFIGTDTKPQDNYQTNQIVIGDSTNGNGSNTVTIGNASITDNYFTANVRGGSFIKTGATGTNLLRADGTDIPMPTVSALWGGISGTLSDQSDLQVALDLKANLASPTFTGTVSGIDKGMVGLENVDNTTDLDKPISTLTQAELNLKANFDSPTFTGMPTLPTGTIGVTQLTTDNSTALATTAFVKDVATANVADAIADEVTTVAPSQNAVFDALDLKANLVSPTFTGIVTSPSFIKSGATASNILRADGEDTTVISSLGYTPYDATNPNNYIGLTALSGTDPLSYNTTTGVFGISKSDTTTNGYLSSADWNTFNNKLDAFGSQTAKTFYAAPNGSAGNPTFRTIVPSDIPTLNQNTTGTASNITGTVAVANGGTGVTTSTGTGSVVLSNSPAFTTPNLGTPSALVGTNITGTATNLTAGASNTISVTNNISAGSNYLLFANSVSGAGKTAFANSSIQADPLNSWVLANSFVSNIPSGNSAVFKMGNSNYITAKNSAGVDEPLLYGRYTDNVTYLQYGSGGFITRSNAGTTAVSANSLGQVTMPSQPSFLAIGAIVNNATGDGTNVQVQFGSEKYDIGNTYDATTSVFTAPVSGQYEFYIGVTINNIGSSHNRFDIYLIASSTTYGLSLTNPYAGNGSGYYKPGNFTMSVYMTAGDTALVRAMVNGGAKTVSIYGDSTTNWSSFGGRLTN